MAREQELKLAVGEFSWPLIQEWLSESGAEALPAQTLRNTYFDTTDAKLNRQRAALRIRQSDEGIVQTLKTKGTASQGLHDRQEWDWPLKRPELDCAALAGSAVGDLAGREALHPVFTTDFERQAWLWRNGGNTIEFALDTGRVSCGKGDTPISEVELELKGGDPSVLVVQGERLSRACPVFLNTVSKAEQGYFLAGLYHPMPKEVPREASFAQFLDAWFQALGLYALTGKQPFLEQARAAVRRLSETQSQDTDLSAGHRLTSEQWSRLVKHHDGLEPAAPEQVREQLLRNPLLGQCQLKLVGS